MAMYENPGGMKGYNISFLIVAIITLLVTMVVQGFFKVPTFNSSTCRYYRRLCGSDFYGDCEI